MPWGRAANACGVRILVESYAADSAKCRGRFGRASIRSYLRELGYARAIKDAIQNVLMIGFIDNTVIKMLHGPAGGKAGRDAVQRHPGSGQRGYRTPRPTAPT